MFYHSLGEGILSSGPSWGTQWVDKQILLEKCILAFNSPQAFKYLPPQHTKEVLAILLHLVFRLACQFHRSL